MREQQPSSTTTNNSDRAQKDLPLVIPESGSVQTVQIRLCECIMDQDRAPDWCPVPLTGHAASHWVHVMDLRGSGKTSAASRMTSLGRSALLWGGLSQEGPAGPLLPLCCPSVAPLQLLMLCLTVPPVLSRMSPESVNMTVAVMRQGVSSYSAFWLLS